MSVLNEPQKLEPTEAVRNAEYVKRLANKGTDALLTSVTRSLKKIWASEAPQGIIDELGTDAKELFELNTNTVQFLFTELTGKRDAQLAEITEILATVPPYTVNEDGTVTITV